MSNLVEKIFQGHFKVLYPKRKLPWGMKRAADKIMNCWPPYMGGRILACPQNHFYVALYNSCKHQGYPQCEEQEKMESNGAARNSTIAGEKTSLIIRMYIA